MAERPIDINVAKGSAANKITDEDKKSRAERKARLATVYHRGIVGDALHVDLPPHLHGEWVPRHDASINRKLALGFTIDTEFAPKQKKSMHDQGDGGSHIVDVVFMTCPRETKELLDEIKAEKFKEMHNPKAGKQKEEKDYLSRADAETAPSASGNVAQVGVHNIADALKAAADQS
jgi:hypothetical protein